MSSRATKKMFGARQVGKRGSDGMKRMTEDSVFGPWKAGKQVD